MQHLPAGGGLPLDYFPAGRTIVDLFEEQVAKTPERIALINGEREFTYFEVNQRADQVADHLISFCSLPPEGMVSVLADRSEFTIFGLLGILKAGGVYIPIDPDSPANRIAYILQDSRCDILLVKGQRAADAYAGSAPLVVDLQNLSTEFRLNRKVKLDDKNLAYVIYTSGSTGNPKGVMIEQRSFVNLALGLISSFDVHASDHVLQFFSPAFDASLFTIFIALLSGAAVVLVDSETIGDKMKFLGYVDEHQVSILSLPPAYLNTLDKAKFQSVKSINTGGDAAITEDALFYGRETRYFSTYGPTECTVCASYHEVNPATQYSHGIPLGQPISHLSVYVLGRFLEPIPAGEVGEICVSGHGLARGYLHRPDLTAEKFVPHPYPSRPGERLYRTGDMGKWLPDGNLYFAGRKDTQVKIRGYRIELGEIEYRLQQYPGIEKAIVLARGNTQSRELCGYLISRDSIDLAALRLHLRETLPEYMIPAHFIVLESLPLTTNGKTDTTALLTLTTAHAKVQSVAPDNPMEEQIARIWAETLNQDQVGVHDDFFELGGQSLRAAQIISKLREVLSLEIGLKEFFDARTVARLAELARDRTQTSAVHIEPLHPGTSYELSHAQARLWFMSQIEENSYAYNIAESYVLDGKLNQHALERALSVLIARHEVLRTRFITLDGQPRQEVRPHVDFKLDIKDLRYNADSLILAAELADREAVTPFDLERGEMLRAKLLQVSDTRHVFLLTIHHIACDGWSIGRLTREISALYAAYAKGLDYSFPPLQFQYKDFAAWQNAFLASPAAGPHCEYWLAKFAGDLQPLNLPTDHIRPAIRTSAGETICGEFDSHLTSGLQHLSQQHGVSLFMTLVAAVKILLHRYTGQTDIIIGTPFADRNGSYFDDQIGFYVNTLALRDTVKGHYTTRALLSKIKKTCLFAYTHQIYPFDRLVDDLGLPKDMSRSPLFDVMVALQRSEDARLVLEDLFTSNFRKSAVGSKFDLSFDFFEDEGKLAVYVEYSTELFERDRIERLLQHLTTLARQMVAEPLLPISKLNLLSSSERYQLIKGFNETAVAHPTHQTILDLFQEFVERSPDHPALLFGDLVLTYRELNDRASALANYYLSHYQIGPESLIGLYLERSELFFVALLSVLKAGAAYVPIDPNYPSERVLHLLEDSGCKLVITERGLRTSINGNGRDILILEEIEDSGVALSQTSPALPINPLHPAYCIYTSGSTGQPKGVLVTHANVVNATYTWRSHYHLDRPVVLQLASFSFDVSFGDFCRSLLSGGTLVIASEEQRVSPQLILEIIERHAVDLYETTPVIARSLIQHLLVQEKQMPPLKLLIVGSDGWLIKEYNQLRRLLHPNTRLINSYGTTETSIDSAYYEPSADSLPGAEQRYVPIGKPMDNVEILITDEQLNVVPIGVSGELCISGQGLARGYLNKPHLTAEKYVPNPFKPGARFYRTGDLAMWLPDGNIAIVGRIDDQAKVRGYRIEPGEIESALINHPNVRRAAVVIQRDRDEHHLVAYLIAEPSVSESGLRLYLGRKLPYYMIPSHFIFLDVFPITRNGKLDRKLLPAATGLNSGATLDDPPPMTEMEHLLVQVWQDVLPEAGKFGVTSSFFSLGGDSIRAIQLVYKAREKGIAIRPSDVFQYLSIRALSQHIVANSTFIMESRAIPLHLTEVPAHILELLTDGDEDVYPASKMQALMLSASAQDERHDGLYHGQSSWHLYDSYFSLPALQEVLQRMIHRHPALRTVFVRDQNGDLFQIVKKSNLTPVTTCDITCLTPDEQDRHISDYMAADLRDPFEVGQRDQPFCRFVIFLRSQTSFELVMSIHHSLDDGWGATQLQNDLIEDYLALRKKESNGYCFPNKTLKEFVALERETQRSEAARNFWCGELAGARYSPLAAKYRVEDGPLFGDFTFRLDDAVAGASREMALRFCVSPKAVYLWHYLRLVQTLRDEPEVIIGVVSNGRTEQLSDPFNAMGLFWNIIPFRHTFQNPHVSGAESVQEHLTANMPYATYPLSQILEDHAVSELFFACYNFVHFHNAKPFPIEEGIRLISSSVVDKFHYPLTFAVCLSADDGSVTLRVQYNRLFFSHQDIAIIVGRYAQLAAG